jgi:hypothetical protein
MAAKKKAVKKTAKRRTVKKAAKKSTKKAVKKTAPAKNVGGAAPRTAKTLEDFQNEAVALGVELHGGETIADLKSLIAAKKSDNAEGADKTSSAAKAPKGATLAHVSKDGELIRTYSVKEHGADFTDHANEFASKEEGRSVEFE